MKPRVLALAAALSLAAAVQAAPPLPNRGQFVAGSGSISGGGQALTITQSSTRGVVDWRSFSIGNGRSVTFNNGSGATLNRVTGGDPSTILGRLSATGSVYLINPQGVLVGPSGVIATNGRFVASTLNADNNAFMQGGPLTLTGSGNGVVVNLGRISSSGGDVFLVARTRAENRGSIDAPQGSAELASGQQVLLQDAAGGQQVFVQVGSSGNVLNAGEIRAAQVNLQGADGNVYALAGNHAAIRATGTAQRNGHVWLVADQGAVHANGTFSATNADGSGGTVETRGNALDVSGANVQAGLWKLGAPAFTLDGTTAATLARNLAAGTSIDAEATGANGSTGDLAVNAGVQWAGRASLTLGAAHSVTIAPNATIKNTGGGNLTLRADANAQDTGGSVTNNGTLDWSASTGIISALYDMTGSYKPGVVLTNATWSPAPYSGLVTQLTGYKLVNTLTDLQNVSQDLAGNYALGTDIDASATRTSPPQGTIFAPIGASTDTPFVGQFDGFGHTIDDLRPSTPTIAFNIPAGLFGVIGTSGVVRNVGVTNATVGASSGIFGAVAGINSGRITYAYSSGGVSIGGFFGSAGGLVGQNNGTIERSWSSVGLGSQGDLGGLVGVNNGTIAQSYATGVVGGGNHVLGGGLVGVNNGTIRQSYATGFVSNLTGAGGLVYDNSSTGVIEESFATGKPDGGPPFAPYGGIAATNEGMIAGDVYWDRQSTGQASAAGFNTGSVPPNTNGLTTAQMSTPASFAPSWDFSATGTWAMPPGATHPVLRWQVSH